MTKEKLALSVIMPALNEQNNIAEAIGSVLLAMEKYGVRGEIIVVNDGSTDKTGSIVSGIISEGKPVRLLVHDRPMGIGFSFWDGVKNSGSDAVVLFPGDNEIVADDAMSFMRLLDEVDMVIPFFHNTEKRSGFRRWVSSLYSFSINVSFGMSLNYTNGAVFYRRKILDEIVLDSFGFLYQTELLVKLIKKGYIYAEVPNTLSVRKGGKSKAINLNSLLRVLRDYLRLFININILRKCRRDYPSLNKESVSYLKKMAGLHNGGGQ